MIRGEIKRLGVLEQAQWPTAAKERGAPLELVCRVAAKGKLPILLFRAGWPRAARAATAIYC
jgi:pyridoxal 5'-phosphate synthase pdxS subunit